MRFSDDQPSTRDFASLVCRRHNFFDQGNLRGGREHVSNAGRFLKLLESLPQSGQIHYSDLWDVGRGGDLMLVVLATPHESLPIRYLGMPLSAGRVSVQD